jgi:hypothetical protein
MKTLKVEAVYLMAYETFEDVTADLPPNCPPSGAHPSLHEHDGPPYDQVRARPPVK